MLIYCRAFCFASYKPTYTLPPPPSVSLPNSDFCSDYICLRTYPRRWVVWAGGSWQEPLQPAAPAHPAPNTWTSKALAQSPWEINNWKAAAIVLFASVTRMFSCPRNVNCDNPASHYHLPANSSRSEDLNIHNASASNGHIYTFISSLLCTCPNVFFFCFFFLP